MEFVTAVRTRYGNRGIAHLDIQPVYLGNCAAYRNWPRSITTVQLRRHIFNEFRTMNAATYRYHPLAEFFEPVAANGNNGGGGGGEPSGYVPKKFALNGNMWPVLQLDHVMPKYWSGPNHPRNYAAMHASFNRSFGDKCPEIKMAYLEEHSSSALRRVHTFLTDLRESSLCVTAEEYFYGRLMLP